MAVELSKKADMLVFYLQEELAISTPDMRLEILRQLSDGYCRSCGTEHLPCYCDNDE